MVENLHSLFTFESLHSLQSGFSRLLEDMLEAVFVFGKNFYPPGGLAGK